jgi:hypothetical protein
MMFIKVDWPGAQRSHNRQPISLRAMFNDGLRSACTSTASFYKPW